MEFGSQEQQVLELPLGLQEIEEAVGTEAAVEVVQRYQSH